MPDPAKSPDDIPRVSCGLGVIHLFVGMGIKAYGEIGWKVPARCICMEPNRREIIPMLFQSLQAPGIGKIMAVVGLVAAMACS